MDNDVMLTIRKISKATVIVFVSIVFSTGINFLNRILIARYFSPSDYGMFNILLTIVSVLLAFFTLGLPNALPREISLILSKDPKKLSSLIMASWVVVAITGVMGMVLLVSSANILSSIFHKWIVEYVNVIALSFPFLALNTILLSSLRGLREIQKQSLLQNVFSPSLFLILTGVTILLYREFIYVFWAYVISQIFVFIMAIVTLKRLNLLLFKLSNSINVSIVIQLLRFSLPLMFSGIAWSMITWMDTLMIGHYLDSTEAGIYNAASPIARFILIFINSLGLVYPALMIPLFMKGKSSEVYPILSELVFIVTLPIFLVLYYFPVELILVLFGSRYIEAARVLKILSVGFMLQVIFGPVGPTLILYKQSVVNMLGNIISLSLNLILNAILIPRLGIEGAAIATSTSVILSAFIKELWLYIKYNITPFHKRYMFMLFFTLGFLIIGTVVNIYSFVEKSLYILLLLNVIIVFFIKTGGKEIVLEVFSNLIT